MHEEQTPRSFGSTMCTRSPYAAGMTTPAAQLTRDGYEVHMQVNHLAHFLLSLSVLPALEQAARLRGSARIVNHSSASRKNPRPTPLQVASFAHEPKLTKSGLMVALNRYQQSKLANMLFTAALQVRSQRAAARSTIACEPFRHKRYGVEKHNAVLQCNDAWATHVMCHIASHGLMCPCTAGCRHKPQTLKPCPAPTRQCTCRTSYESASRACPPPSQSQALR